MGTPSSAKSLQQYYFHGSLLTVALSKLLLTSRHSNTAGVRTKSSSSYSVFDFSSSLWWPQKLFDKLPRKMRVLVVISFVICLSGAEAGRRSKRPPLLTEGCPACDKTACTKVRQAQCPSREVTRDACGCCKVCASGLGERCGGFSWADGICGKGLFCARYMLHFQARIEFGEAGTCVCFERDSVCGADGNLYDDVCTLRKINNERKVNGLPKIGETKLRTCGGGKPANNCSDKNHR